jgi:pyruvate,water dikinase
MSQAARELCMPFTEMNARFINSFVYFSPTMYSPDPARMEARMGAMQQKMFEHVPGLYQRWADKYEPEVRAINDETRTTDYRALSDRELSDRIEGLIARREREGMLHFLAVFPAGGAVRAYEEMYTRLVGPPRNNEHYELLQGFPNRSIAGAIRIWGLAAEARRRPEVLRVLHEVAPAAAHAALATVEGGPAFRGAVDEYLDEFGWRSNEFDIASPTWKEEPTMVYSLLHEYVGRPDYDLEQEQRALAAAREAKQRVVMQKVEGAGPAAAMFSAVLAGAQTYLPIQEDHNFWIDQQGACVQRVPLLEAARRLVGRGILGQDADVFMLKYDELQGALRAPGASLSELAAQRRAERQRQMTMTPPRELGRPRTAEEQAEAQNDTFFGVPPEASADPRVINGRGASGGRATGIARVILSLDDAGRLSKGEILVCPATMPPWTPLFGIASAVVTNHGGVLSHTAIVAREYRIPAVLATQFATELIRDGQRVTVDGDAGTVLLEE